MGKLNRRTPLCQCGCGQSVTPGSKYIRSHNRRTANYFLPKVQQPCQCGCGELTSSGMSYVCGHNRRGKSSWNTGSYKRKFCKCGCGTEVFNNKYVLGHYKPFKKTPVMPQLCECQCGGYAKPKRRFISGHNARGMKRFVETLKKMEITNALPKTKANRSVSQKIAQNRPETKLRNSIGVKKSCAKPEIKAKRSASQKIAANRPERIKKLVASLEIANSKPEVKERRRQGQKIANAKPEVHERRSKSATEVAARPGVKESKSRASKRNWQNQDYIERVKSTAQITNEKPEVKAKRSAIQKEIQNRLEVKEKKSITMNKPEAKAERSKCQKANWKDPNYVGKQMKSRNVKQNKLEKRGEDLFCNLFPSEYKFVGYGEVIIDGKCPDFINVNCQKKIIELYGDYWHKEEDPQDRIDIFAKFGYDTLIVWEREFKDIKSLTRKLIKFHYQENPYAKHKE